MKIIILALGLLIVGEVRSLVQDELIEVYTHQTNQWEEAPYEAPQHFPKIFQSLPQSHWPALPESYEWRILPNDTIKLFRHVSSRSYNFDFVVYGPNEREQINFLSRWDNTTHHAFTYTRNPPLNNEYARNTYPINADGYKIGTQTYVRGHLIDFCDTMNLEDEEMVAGGTIDQTISTLDPRNYHPEPPRSHWGLSLRKDLVRSIRVLRGCYAQYMYYSETPLATRYGTHIPDGCYFAEMGRDYTIKQVYHVPWNHPIHQERAQGNTWQDRLAPLIDFDSFVPSPFVHNQREEIIDMDFKDLPFSYELPDGKLSYKSLFQLTQAADHEMRSVVSKTNLVYYLLKEDTTPRKIEMWLKRLLLHADFMDDKLRVVNFLPTEKANNLLDLVRLNEGIDGNDQMYDHLRRIIRNQEEGRIRLDTLWQEVEETIPQRLLVVPAPIVIPFIDMASYPHITKTMYANIIGFLRTNEQVEIRNLTTPRATKIAERIRGQMTAGVISPRAQITYTVSPTKNWNVQKPFTERNIAARRLTFSG